MMRKATDPVLIIGSPCEASDVRYATGFMPLDPVVFAEVCGRRFLVVPALELGRASQGALRIQVFTPDDLPIARKERRRVSGWALGLLRKLEVRRVTVSGMCPVAVVRRLEKAGIRAAISKTALFPSREVKNRAEIARIRQSQRAAVAAMNAAVSALSGAAISPGGYLTLKRRRLTSEEIRYIIEATLLRHGTCARDTIVAGGRQAADPHERGHGPLRAGEAIVLDIFPQHKEHGYWGDITRTVVRGTPSAELKRMYRAVLRAQQTALHSLRAGVKGSTIHERVVRALRRAGFATCVRQGMAEGFFHSTGHGVGLDVHEGPTLGPSGGRLKTGHIVTVEPGLYYPRIGGIRIEDTVVVTSRGWNYLATCEKRFEV